jgi:hypothetical protein
MVHVTLVEGSAQSDSSAQQQLLATLASNAHLTMVNVMLAESTAQSVTCTQQQVQAALASSVKGQLCRQTLWRLAAGRC